MQSYLGDYPGSRSNPEQKFIRAVYSFLMQDYVNKELVIVSDGCKITERLYNAHFKHYSEVKYIYFDKEATSPKMYEDIDGTKHFRGMPRKIGNDNATGDIICYLDSDDYLKQNYLTLVERAWSMVSENHKWIVNRSWYDNEIIETNPLDESFKVLEKPIKENAIIIDGLDSKWIAEKVNQGYVITSTFLITHKRNCGVEWCDSNGTHEDQEFYKKLEKIGSGMFSTFAGYVRCHYTKRWDL